MSDPAADARSTDAAEERVALALAALGEITDPADVGGLIDVRSPAEGVADLRFACTLAGYAGWVWTVSTAQIVGAAPTVLEVELLPEDGALLAPPWVPWTERLAEWRRTHPKGHDGADDDDLDEDDDDLGDDEVADGLDDDGLDEQLGDLDDDDLADADADADSAEDDDSDDDSDGDDSDEYASDEDDSDDSDDEDEDDDSDEDDEDRDEGLREP